MLSLIHICIPWVIVWAKPLQTNCVARVVIHEISPNFADKSPFTNPIRAPTPKQTKTTAQKLKPQFTHVQPAQQPASVAAVPTERSISPTIIMSISANAAKPIGAILETIWKR